MENDSCHMRSCFVLSSEEETLVKGAWLEHLWLLSVAMVCGALGLFLARMFLALMFGFDFRLNHHNGMVCA